MSTVDLLRAHPPRTPDELRERVLALRPPEPRRRLRVRPVLVLAAALALAIAAAVVHGFRTSAPVARHELPQATTAAVGGGAAANGRLAPKDFAVPSASPNRIQHTDASIRIRVDDAGAATSKATRIATGLGGYAQSVVYDGGQASLDLRIPTANVQKALAQLGGLGTLVSQHISIEDLTHKLQLQSAQIAQLRRRVAALQKALHDPALPDAQRVLLQIKLSEAKRALAQRVNGQKGTLAQGATSRVSLVLTTKKAAAAAPHGRGRVGRMLHSALGFLAIEGLVFLFALIVASPIVLALGVVWFVRRRATERLLVG
jgi:ribosomal protein L25 (general stress protein Ctc)